MLVTGRFPKIFLGGETIGRQKVGYGMVVDGFAKFQALIFGISGPEISEEFSF